METAKVGIREFRADLAGYSMSNTPVAVTRHGQTIGYFIPTQAHVEANVLAFKKASAKLIRLIEEKGINVEEVVAEFKAARKKAARAKSPKVKTA